MMVMLSRQALAPTLSLFTSAGTLICCALPAVFITLGMGATFASMVSAFPQLIWLSAHKGAVFTFAGAMLALAGYLRWRSRNDPCPIDQKEAQACMRLRRRSGYIYWFSVAIYATGAFFAFIAPGLI
ncbi:MAG: hypothetical protein MRY59_10580 [Aquisalinus sp.]|nr:hypothetical protein [Aquisalinus sp.]